MALPGGSGHLKAAGSASGITPSRHGIGGLIQLPVAVLLFHPNMLNHDLY